MIFDRLSQVRGYFALGPRIETALRYLEHLRADVPPGRYEVDGSRLYAMVQEYTSKSLEQGFWEAHRRFVDLQAVLLGEERMGYAPAELLAPGPYDEERDLVKLEGQGEFLLLRPGMFMLLFPQDAHMPGLAVGQPGPVRKVVVKIAVAEG